MGSYVQLEEVEELEGLGVLICQMLMNGKLVFT